MTRISQNQSRWADEACLPRDVLRLCMKTVNERCHEWPERRSIVAMMGVCRLWRSVVLDMLAEEEDRQQQQQQQQQQQEPDKPEKGIAGLSATAWLSHPRRLVMPLGRPAMMPGSSRWWRDQTTICCLIERSGTGRFRSYKVCLSKIFSSHPPSLSLDQASCLRPGV